jgi:hypothetical protein
MRVTLNCHRRGHHPGDVVDLPDAEAGPLLALGAAHPAPDPAPAPVAPAPTPSPAPAPAAAPATGTAAKASPEPGAEAGP